MDESARPTVDPALADCLARNSDRPAADITSMTPQQARAVYAESRLPWNDGQPAMAEVVRGLLPGGTGGLRFVRLVPQQAEPGTVVYFHGGGWVTGSIATHDGIMRRLAELSGRSVVGLDYPLAPETRRAAMLAACLAALRQVMEEGEGPVVLAGDSAGAELALACALALRDAGARLPDGLCLAYPALWPRFETPSHLRLGDGRFGHSTAKMRAYWQHYLGDDEEHLPARPELSGLPPCYLLGAQYDCLLDDTLDLARLLREAGAAPELSVPAGSVHGFLHYAAAAPIALDALRDLARFIRTCG